MTLEECPTEIALSQGRAVWGCEAILERTDGSRIPIVPYPKPLRDGSGTIVGVINMTVDIGERKKAELALAERNAQIALAGKVALVGSYAYDVNTGAMRGNYRDDNQSVVDEGAPRGLRCVKKLRDQTFADQRDGLNTEFRIVR